MNTTLILTRTDGAWWYELPVTLGDRDFMLDFTFVAEGGAVDGSAGEWWLTVRTAAGEALGSSCLMVTHALFQGRAWLPGVLIVTDAAGTGQPPGLLELGEGRRCELLYLEA